MLPFYTDMPIFPVFLRHFHFMNLPAAGLYLPPPWARFRPKVKGESNAQIRRSRPMPSPD